MRRRANDRERWVGQLAVEDMEIGAAHAARFDANQRLGAPRRGLGAFREDQRRADCAQRHRALLPGARLVRHQDGRRRLPHQIEADAAKQPLEQARMAEGAGDDEVGVLRLQVGE